MLTAKHSSKWLTLIDIRKATIWSWRCSIVNCGRLSRSAGFSCTLGYRYNSHTLTYLWRSWYILIISTTKNSLIFYVMFYQLMSMDEVISFASVPDHPLLHILSFLKYSDLAAYVRHFVENSDITGKLSYLLTLVLGVSINRTPAAPAVHGLTESRPHSLDDRVAWLHARQLSN